MNSGLNLNSGEQSWWKQPHMPGRIMVLTAVLTFSYFFGQKLMYGIFGLFGAMWGLIACGLTIGLVFFFYKHVITAFEVLSYKLADFFIKIDPITNARVQLSRAWRKLMILKEAVTDLTGQLLDTNTTLQTNQSKIDKNIDDAKRITNDTRIPEDDKQDVQVLVAEAEELRKWNEELLPLRDTMLAMRDGLKAAFNAGDLQLREQKARLDINEQKYKSIAVTWGAIFKAQGLFGGNPGQRNEFELAMKEIQRSTSQKAAKIDSFMEQMTDERRDRLFSV